MRKLPPPTAGSALWPSESELAALRVFHSGLDTRTAVARYLPDALGGGRSARGVLAAVRRALLTEAHRRRRPDLVAVLLRAGRDRDLSARRLQSTVDELRASAPPEPGIGDDVALWFSPRIARVLAGRSIYTLADLAVRIPRRRGWWRGIVGLGAVNARRIEAFFASHPRLTASARALVKLDQEELIPWERLQVPDELNGSRGAFRAPRRRCVLAANNDYEAVQAWLQLHESAVTRRTYRKEAERLILWAILERGKALSSLATEDAVAYRTFLRQPSPKRRWIGPVAVRTSPQWRPFQGPLSPRSAAYALSVISALFRWLVEQRYLIANPFAGVRVKAIIGRTQGTSRAFSEHEWSLVRPVADGLDDQGWSEDAAGRLRFALDFAYATGLRSSELVAARLGQLHDDETGNRWIEVLGKGNKAGKVVVPSRARLALDRYLAAREIPTSPTHWSPDTPLLANLKIDDAGLTGARLWAIMKRFFKHAADALEPVNRPLAEKLRRASPHWMRHTHATHALARGATLTTVRDNLRHVSISTISGYLHTDEAQRAKEIATAFADAIVPSPHERRRRADQSGRRRAQRTETLAAGTAIAVGRRPARGRRDAQ